MNLFLLKQYLSAVLKIIYSTDIPNKHCECNYTKFGFPWPPFVLVLHLRASLSTFLCCSTSRATPTIGFTLREHHSDR